MTKKKAKKNITISGKTADGQLVLKGLFLFVGSLGLPLTDVLFKCKESNFVVDWIDFYEDALKDGYKSKTILNKIEEAVVDVLGKSHKDVLLKRLHYYIEKVRK